MRHLRPTVLRQEPRHLRQRAKLDVVNYAFENIDPVNLTCLSGVTKGTTADPQDPDQGTGAGDADADYSRPFSAAQSVDGVADDG